jgi:predicted DNA-binding protein (MmcQ/YjbR family)
MELRGLEGELRRFGLAFPETREDHPWGELVLKVRAKVFVFLGRPGGALTLSLKLPRTAERLLDADFAAPTGYGLGKSGWVTLTLARGDEVELADLRAWIEESYRAVAPRTLVRALDGAPGPTPAPRPRRKA